MNFDFDAPYDDADPWGFRSRWYESRRRALVLACLPRQRFAHALELGCANGEMTASLAGRADALLALDASARAIALARQRVTAPHVRLAQAELPREWPAGRFDLIVLSEIGYYLSPADLRATADAMCAALAPDGVVLAAHWRHPFEGKTATQEQVHATLHERLALERLGGYLDADLCIDVLAADTRSIATREGLAP